MTGIRNPNRLIILLAGLQAFGPLSIDLLLPALPQIASDLKTSESDAQLSISAFLTGLFIGMIFHGPLSDKYGRRRLLLSGIGIYVIATLGCLLAGCAAHLVAWRFVQALGGAAASVLGRAIVRDLFPLNQAARALSLMHMVTMVAALLSPLVASYVLMIATWRWLFVGLLVFSASLLVIIALRIPETHTGASRGSEISAVFKAYLAIGKQPLALGYILCMSLCFAGMFAYITVSSFVFIDFFGLTPQQYAWLFGANIIGIMAFVFINSRLVQRLGTQRMLHIGAGICALAGLVLVTTSLLGIAGFWLIAIGLFAHISCTGILGANCTASLMNIYSNNAGAAAGLAVATQFGLGALASVIISRLYDGTPLFMSLLVGSTGMLSLTALLLTHSGHDPAGRAERAKYQNPSDRRPLTEKHNF